MHAKKSLLTLGTLSTLSAVTLAGAGVAAADDGVADTEGSAVLGSIQTSTSDGALDPSGSIDAHGFFNQFWKPGETGVIDGQGAVNILTGVAAAAASVATIAGAYNAVVSASDTWQGVVNDTLGFLALQGIVLPN